MARSPLFDANESLDLTLPWKLLICRNSTIVEGLIHEQDYCDQTQPCFDRVDAKRPLPFLGRNDERRDQRSKVRRQNDERGPDVDLARMLMEEKNVLDEHQPTTLRNRGEEPVQDPRSHERVIARRTSAPRRSPHSRQCKPEHHRQSTKVCRQRNNEDAACAQHEHIARLRMIHIVFAQMPDRRLWQQRDSSRRTAVVGQKGCSRDDEQDDVFLRLAPVQRVVGIVAGLWDEDGVAVGRELEVAIGWVVLVNKVEVDDVAVLFADGFEVERLCVGFDDAVGFLLLELVGVHGQRQGRWVLGSKGFIGVASQCVHKVDYRRRKWCVSLYVAF